MDDAKAELHSLDLVLDVLRTNRAQRQALWDALDQKAGIAIGFAGVLVTLSVDVPLGWRVAGVVLAVLAGMAGVVAIMPGTFRVLRNVRLYLAVPEAETRLALVDVLDSQEKAVDDALNRKADALKAAFLLLACAIAVLAVGVIEHKGGR